MDYKIEKLQTYIEVENIEAIHYLMNEYDLEIKNDKIQAKDLVGAKAKQVFFDQRQLATKILLNSLKH